MPSYTVEQYEEWAREVVLDMLDQLDAVTIGEMEARASDRTWNVHVAPLPINPHHLTNARTRLLQDGEVVASWERTRGGQVVSTWALTSRATRRTVTRTAARKRLLTARHDGWSRRGGAGRGLLGAAGEQAMHHALLTANRYAAIQHSIQQVLDVDLSDLGELDFAAGLYDVTTNPLAPAAVTVLVEVKNTRQWYYDDELAPGGQVWRFLRKAARVQAQRPDAAICPVFVARRCHDQLVKAGRRDGFLVASTDAQVVLVDHEMERRPTAFTEVRDELGYVDLRQLTTLEATPNSHRGIAAKLIPKAAGPTAALWRAMHVQYL